MNDKADIESLPKEKRDEALLGKARSMIGSEPAEAFDILDGLQKRGFRQADCLMLKGEICAASGIFDVATGLYEAALAVDPNGAQCLVKKGALMERMGRKEEALACYEHAISLRPRYLAAIFQMAELLFWMGRRDEAIQLLESAEQVNPLFSQVWYQKAKAFYALERWDDCMGALEKALHFNNDFPRAAAMRAELLLRVDRGKQALEICDTILENDDEFWPAMALKRDILRSLGRDDDAEEVDSGLRESWEDEPDRVPRWGVRYGRGPAVDAALAGDKSIMRDSAELLMRIGQPGRALAIFSDLYRSGATDARTFRGLGICLFELRRCSEADWFLQKALDAYKDDPRLLGMRGWCIASTGNYVDSLDFFNKALKLDPANQQAWRDGGQVLVALKKLDVAVAFFEKAVANDPSDVSSWARYASALADMKKYPESLAACERALGLSPRHPFAWFVKSRALRAQKRVPEANWALKNFEEFSKG